MILRERGRDALPKAPPVCCGSRRLATKSFANVSSNQPRRFSYDKAAFAGSDISPACWSTSLERTIGRPNTRWANSIRHNLPSAVLNTTNAAHADGLWPTWVEGLCKWSANAQGSYFKSSHSEKGRELKRRHAVV